MQEPWQVRAGFARRLSLLYGQEVPAYTTLVEVAHEVNHDVADKLGADAERLGSLDRVTAERHGAIRVGSPAELAQVARVFGAMGMHPTGYYDLRDAEPGAVPVVSTAFRPSDELELARNPFRVFTSVLATPDRRYFTPDLAGRIDTFLAGRQLFAPRLLELADRGERHHGFEDDDALEFLDLATTAFAMSPEPVDRAWYDELTQVSAVAADIAGVGSTHVNHLTPRVLDIGELYARMASRGVEMIDAIQGPPADDVPPVLLRQTSFRALAEPRRFREADGTVTEGALRVRFGEVEARGIALTREGRRRFEVSGTEGFPTSEAGLASSRIGVFEVRAVPDRPRDGRPPAGDLAELLDAGWLRADPVVYEDFLPRSAAGIFRSNLTADGTKRDDLEVAPLDAAWLAGVLGRDLLDPHDLYEARSTAAEQAAREELGL